MSGGFFWSDELLRETSAAPKDVAHRAIIGYRASLIDGQPREELRGGWDQLRRECPDWPGFRPERCDLALKDEQELANRRGMRRLEAFGRLMRRESPAER